MGFKNMVADQNFTLPCTFRYGYPLNRIVQSMVASSNPGFTIDTARNTGTQVFQVNSLAQAVSVAKGEMHCICRYNMGILEEMISVVGIPNICIDAPSFIAKMGGIEFTELIQILHLYKGEHHLVTSKNLRKWPSFDAYMNAMRSTDRNQDKLLMCTSVELYGGKLLGYIGMIQQSMSRSGGMTVHFVTAHGSKGNTYDSVYVAKGFRKCTTAGSVEEQNILYVALTRASRRCYIEDSLWDTFWD